MAHLEPNFLHSPNDEARISASARPLATGDMLSQQVIGLSCSLCLLQTLLFHQGPVGRQRFPQGACLAR